LGLMSENMKIDEVHNKPHGQRNTDLSDHPAHIGHSSITAHCLSLNQELFDATWHFA
jgi:hypothetical protein